MKLLIATSLRGGDLMATPVSYGYSVGVRRVAEDLGAEILDGEIPHACDNTRARNRVVGLVLRELPHIGAVLFWDDDQWPEDPRIVREMLATGEDVIGAPYTNKTPPLHWVHEPLAGATMRDGVLEVKSLGFGFTITSRACLEKMVAGERRYTDHPHPHKIANIFGALYDRVTPSDDPEDERLMSEDFSFCKRWRALGGRVTLYAGAGLIRHAGMRGWSATDMPGGVVA